MVWTAVVLAIVVGMHHALEADHVAAVSSLVAGKKSMREMVTHGLNWGLGHTLTLFLASAAALFLGRAIPAQLASGLEAAVGLMLIGLGSHVLWRIRRDRVHFHVHSHGAGATHFHAHSHAGDVLRHRYSLHEHRHGFRLRSLLVGMTHGLAGSAALLVLAVSQFSNPLHGLGYVLLFGLGSMVGMALVSAAISIPLRLTAALVTRLNLVLQAGTGLLTIAIGAVSLTASALALMPL